MIHQVDVLVVIVLIVESAGDRPKLDEPEFLVQGERRVAVDDRIELHDLIAEFVAAFQRIFDQKPADSLTAQEWEVFAYGLKNWCFSELEDTGWKNAQTTGGGVRLACLEPESFMLRDCPGLYVVGETVDCAGACGGFNLHFAFGSGILAGRHAADN